MARRAHKNRISIKWKLFAYLALFVAFALLVVWFFQIWLLDYFYERNKLSELEEVASALSAYADNAELSEAVHRCAVESSACIRVFEIKSNMAVEVASADVSVTCLIHHITNNDLSSLYKSARNNDGIYMETREVKAGQYSLWNPSDRFNPFVKIIDTEEVNQTALYVRIVESASSGKIHVIMLNADLSPVSATVKTLQMQFGFIIVIMLVGASLLALFISRHISRPITKINESVQRLAAGDYEVEFYNKGYREASELADALRHAADELARADTLKKELIANVSHDLRTPLTMITGYGEVMRDLPGENTPENVQVIIDESRRLGELVNDMLDLSKFQSGVRLPEKQCFDLTELICRTMERYEKLKSHDGYHIEFEQDRHVSVCADRSMILQVIYNFINNAVNYTGEDKVVRVTQTVHEDKVRIAVSDTGEGIAPEDLALVWDRYYKVDKTHKRSVIGTGLGLSIVKNILELHGAVYGIDSVMGKGSTFWFELSIRPEEGEL